MTKEQERLLDVARGCMDYGGGYSKPAELEVFHHGIQTVINALDAAIIHPSTYSVRVLESIGLQVEPQPMTPERAEQHSLRDLLDGQREIMKEIRELKRSDPGFVRLLAEYNKLQKAHEALHDDYTEMRASVESALAAARSLRELASAHEREIADLKLQNLRKCGRP